MSEASGIMGAILTQVGDNRELVRFSSEMGPNHMKWTPKPFRSVLKPVFIQNFTQARICIETSKLTPYRRIDLEN